MTTLTPEQQQNLAQRFQDLATQWDAATRYRSNTHALRDHPVYQELVALGEPAVPLILMEVEREPNVFWFLVLATITGENPVPPAASTPGKVAPLDEVTLERSGHGEPPTYKVVLSKDGTVTDTGLYNVSRIGTFRAKIQTLEFQRLEELINHSRYFDMDDEQYHLRVDFPWVETSALRGAQRKTIQDGWGSDAPVELWAIEMAIDGLVSQITEWKQIK